MSGPSNWPRRPTDPVLELKLPRFYGSVPTLFGAPRAHEPADLANADIAFLGVPWQAPVPDTRVGAAGASYFGTNLTPQTFRTNSIKYGSYLPELDVDISDHFQLVDYGDVEIALDHAVTFDNTVARVREILQAGAMPFTLGGNSGPATYGVLKAVGQEAGGPVAVINFDAHHDNIEGEMEDDTPELPRWGSTWARRILDLKNVDPARYTHIGLRGPRNDRAVFQRFIDKGVRRENIHTFWEIYKARREGYQEWVEAVVAEPIAGARKVWLAVDPDVLDMSVSDDFGDEPLGLYPEEVCWGAYAVGQAAGRERFAGLAFMATPFDAMKLHWVLMYVFLYAMAGVAHSANKANK